MNPLIAYARLPMAFLHLYRRKHARSDYKFVIGMAMTSTLLVNVVSLILLISWVDHGWLASRRRITTTEYGALVLGALVAELVFVDYVQNKVRRDARFAEKIGNPRPKMAIWYVAITIAAFLLSIVVTLALKSS